MNLRPVNVVVFCFVIVLATLLIIRVNSFKPDQYTIRPGTYGVVGEYEPCLIVTSDIFWVDGYDFVEYLSSHGYTPQMVRPHELIVLYMGDVENAMEGISSVIDQAIEDGVIIKIEGGS